MSLTIIGERADNGNRFLCLECKDSVVRSGTHSQMDVFCNSRSMPTESGRVKFRVTACASFVDKQLKPQKSLRAMVKQAYYIYTSDETSTPVVIDPAKGRERGLDHETMRADPWGFDD